MSSFEEQLNIEIFFQRAQNHENELLKLFRDKAHHQHDACASF